ncbi:serine/threonine-protein kinase/endoribonuclease IRE1 [Tanacetum coccineum]
MWMVSSPTGTCYLVHKDTGKIKWLAETNNQFIYIACKGDDVTDYVDLKPQHEYQIRWLENDYNMYHFKNGTEQQIIPLDTQETTQQIMNFIYKDLYTKVDVRTNTYYFDHTSGEQCEERPSAFKVERSDFYVHRASPSWSIRCSRLKAWFPAYRNKEIYRRQCVVFHARDSCKFFQACKRFNMMPPPEANPLNEFVLTSNLYETNKKIECLATGVVIAEGKHNMSIIEGTYDKVKAVVKKVKIMDDSKGTELKKKLRDARFHENLVAFLDCESDHEYNYYAYEEGGSTLADHINRHPYVEMDESSMKIITGLVEGVKHLHDQGLVHTNLNPWNILVKGSTTVKICDGKLKDLQDIAHVILYIVSKGVHLLKDVVAVNPGLVDEKDLMKLVGTNAEVIDLLKKIGIVQLQTAQPRSGTDRTNWVKSARAYPANN